VIEPPETPKAAEAKISRILCPVNMTEIARQAAREASALATRFNAQLIIVHVVEGRSPSEESERQLRKWLANDVKPDVAWREIVMRGGTAERVLDCADDLSVDLLVTGATTERLIRFAKCPVLTVIRGDVATHARCDAYSEHDPRSGFLSSPGVHGASR
jgi:nucleotide-binding universal stress UspA family protein